MSESGDGLSVAATRQKETRLLNVSPPAGPAAGGRNAPAATVDAAVIVASFRLSEARLSQDADATAVRLTRNPATITALNPPLRSFNINSPATRIRVFRVFVSFEVSLRQPN